MTTQIVDYDDAGMGIYHEWIRRIAERMDRLDVVCLHEGEHNLPNNVHVHSMGKTHPNQTSTFGERMRYVWNLYRHALRLLPKSDLLFVHMNHRYVVLLWIWALLFRVPIVLFKAHRQKQPWLHLALWLSRAVVSYSNETFYYTTDKLLTVPPAVDVDRFYPVEGIERQPWECLFVGRLSPVKRVEDAIEAVAQLRKNGEPAMLRVVGGPASAADHDYVAALRETVQRRGLERVVMFEGAVSNNELAKYYTRAGFLLNFCNATGVDKTLLEAAACGCIPITNQTTFAPFVRSLGGVVMAASVEEGVDRIVALQHDDRGREGLRRDLRRLMHDNHTLDHLTNKLVGHFESIIRH